MLSCSPLFFNLSPSLSLPFSLLGVGPLDAQAVFLGLVMASLSYCKLLKKMEEFVDLWGVRVALCTVDEGVRA